MFPSVTLGMCRSCRGILSSISEEEKLSKLGEEKLPPVVPADNQDDDVVSQMKELTLVRKMVMKALFQNIFKMF